MGSDRVDVSNVMSPNVNENLKVRAMSALILNKLFQHPFHLEQPRSQAEKAIMAAV